jgi:deferrochelatase/peroxidase EfeB
MAGDAPVIASDAHIRIARAAGPGMLRRGYSFDNGPRATGSSVDPNTPTDHAEHGHDDHSSMVAAMDDHDAGLFFAAFVRDPLTQFVPMQQALSANDALGHFLAYTSAGLWAIPAGARRGAIAAELFA